VRTDRHTPMITRPCGLRRAGKNHCLEDWGKTVIIPIHNKGDKKECSNYRGISLLNVPGKVYTGLLQQRLKKYAEKIVRGTSRIQGR